MVASTDIKWFSSDNLNAPQLTNDWGVMIGVLDACLINGFSVQTVATLTASGAIATATFNSAHQYKQYQVIEITGANQSEYNGQARILTIPNANSLTFELSNVPSVTTATGTITCKLPPLGFEKTFSSSTALGGGRAAYRSGNNSVPNRPHLRVVDERITNYNANYAKYAKVGIVENMTDIDTMTGVQAPYIASAATRNWNPTGSGLNIKNGWAKWYYFTLGENYADSTSLSDYTPVTGSWLVVGTDSGFYILNSASNDPSITEDDRQRSFCYGFGNFDSIADDDLFTHFLLATNIWEIAQGITYRAEAYTSSVTIGSENNDYLSVGRSIFLQRGYKKSAYAQATCGKVSVGVSAIVSGGTSSYSVAADKIGGVLLQSPLIIEVLDTSLFLPRGFLPIIKTIPHKAFYTDLQIVEQAGRVFIARKVHGSVGTPDGIIMFDLGEL